jgi:tetratricopeptide (TPR) repeat protein
VARYNYYRGYKAWELQEHKEAIAYLSNSVIYDRTYYKSYLLLGAIHADLNHHYDAAENMTLAIENARGFYPEFYLRRGLSLLHSRIREEGEADISLARRHGLLNHQVRTQIGKLYLTVLYDYMLARLYFVEALQETGGASEELHYLLSISAQKLRDYPEEIHWLSESIKRFGGSANMYYQRAWAYINNQETETGCADWTRARQIDPSLKDQMLGFYCLPFESTDD